VRAVVLAAVAGGALGAVAGALARAPEEDDRIERYCRLRELSFREALSVIEGPEPLRLATAERLLVSMEHRLAFDELVRCKHAFDLGRYRGCLASRDYACMVEVIRATRDP
jgi:hypothetical protein